MSLAAARRAAISATTCSRPGPESATITAAKMKLGTTWKIWATRVIGVLAGAVAGRYGVLDLLLTRRRPGRPRCRP
jgi:hypothetical protein